MGENVTRELQAWFPTMIWKSRFTSQGSSSLCTQLLKEVARFEEFDDEGRKWSKKNYPYGYTSYSSIDNLHQRSNQFLKLSQWIDHEVIRFGKKLGFDFNQGKLSLDTFWINRMGQGSYHSFHIHPRSVVSGTFYLSAPKGSAPLCFEDPKASALMAVPPKKAQLESSLKSYIEFTPQDRGLILFESWLKHEVKPHSISADRVSLSFNYRWDSR